VWQQILDRLPIILPVLVPGLVIAGWLARGLRRLRHFVRRANVFLTQVLGSPGQPSLMDRMGEIERKIDDHLTWHGDPGGKPAAPSLDKPNGPTPVRRRTS
jgi:hypothetical protein